MSINNHVIRSKFYEELSLDLRKKYFNLSSKKFISNVDTLYYTCFLKDDSKENKSLGMREFIRHLECFRDEIKIVQQDIWFNHNEDLLYSRKRFKNYDHCISKNNHFDIFICSSLPNDVTPRIIIQLRSIGLWHLGTYEETLQSYKSLKSILSSFGLEVERVQENRLDFCYHTNSIQNPFKFYSDNNILKSLKTTMKIYHKVGRIEDNSITIDYLSLGQRKSNNLFFRSYNKVREVIEENYKEFFLEYWFNIKLINFYDFYVYSYAYKVGRYDSIYKGMLYFYVEYGQDIDRVSKYKSILEDPNSTIEDIRLEAKYFMPDVTKVVNIEYQTMRKFYYYSDSLIDGLPINYKSDEPVLRRIFQILDNRKIFLDYLTDTTVSFVKDNKSKKIEFLDYWKRLRSCKLDKTVNLEYTRDYSKNLNIELLVSRLKSTLASISLYKGNFDSTINDDMSLCFSILNDNTFKHIEDGVIEIIDNEYMQIKEKRKKALKSLLASESSSSPSHEK